MNYARGLLSAIAAIFIAESVFLWPFLKPAKATGMSALAFLLVESLLSPKFWIVCLLSSGVFFAASRASTVLRVVFFWIPTVAVSTIGFAIVGLYTYLYFSLVSRVSQLH